MPKVTCLTKQKANLIPKLNHLTKVPKLSYLNRVPKPNHLTKHLKGLNSLTST